jgi:hypothetical protein
VYQSAHRARKIDDERCFRLEGFHHINQVLAAFRSFLCRQIDRRQEQSVEARLMIKSDGSINVNFISFVVIVRASRLVKAKNYKNGQRKSSFGLSEPALKQATTTIIDIRLSRHGETSLKLLI